MVPDEKRMLENESTGCSNALNSNPLEDSSELIVSYISQSSPIQNPEFTIQNKKTEKSTGYLGLQDERRLAC